MRLAGAAGGVMVTVAAVESDEVRPRSSTVRTVYDSAVPDGRAVVGEAGRGGGTDLGAVAQDHVARGAGHGIPSHLDLRPGDRGRRDPGRRGGRRGGGGREAERQLRVEGEVRRVGRVLVELDGDDVRPRDEHPRADRHPELADGVERRGVPRRERAEVRLEGGRQVVVVGQPPVDEDRGAVGAAQLQRHAGDAGRVGQGERRAGVGGQVAVAVARPPADGGPVGRDVRLAVAERRLAPRPRPSRRTRGPAT